MPGGSWNGMASRPLAGTVRSAVRSGHVHRGRSPNAQTLPHAGRGTRPGRPVMTCTACGSHPAGGSNSACGAPVEGGTAREATGECSRSATADQPTVDQPTVHNSDSESLPPGDARARQRARRRTSPARFGCWLPPPAPAPPARRPTQGSAGTGGRGCTVPVPPHVSRPCILAPPNVRPPRSVRGPASALRTRPGPVVPQRGSVSVGIGHVSPLGPWLQ